MKKSVCYLSGAITGVPDYAERFAAYEKYLEGCGYAVINPVKINSMLPEGTEYEEFLIMCRAMIDISDVVFQMPNCENSRGCHWEQVYAEEKGIPVITCVDDGSGEDRSEKVCGKCKHWDQFSEQRNERCKFGICDKIPDGMVYMEDDGKTYNFDRKVFEDETYDEIFHCFEKI